MCTCNRKHLETLGHAAEKEQHLLFPPKEDDENQIIAGSSFVNRQLESLQHLHV